MQQGSEDADLPSCVIGFTSGRFAPIVQAGSGLDDRCRRELGEEGPDSIGKGDG